ncbi:hypothetical protein A3709_19465 [Halioglobus sp. HI00S01]|uniref:hypothetical protein n=1 Tax=Halioglobus sp. HI00S01 TaxID=1822214 RepID=UPI0007C3DC78|nr:hypothetical protein [Halioglobus sp. HI00S01]KZX57804.1 hypothetical protein A3709_19465 [Halioglobus sp. HI00S01]
MLENQVTDTQVTRPVAVDDWAGISSLRDSLKRACAKTCSKDPDSFGDQLVRASLALSHAICFDTEKVEDALRGAIDLINQYESQRFDAYQRSGLTHMRRVQYALAPVAA